MPTYEYACKACDHNFEIVQSFSEDSLTTCPECEQDALRKVYNAAGIIFKGDGWHIKDYAGSGAPASTSSPSDSGSDSSSDSGSSSSGGDSTASGSSGSDSAKKSAGKAKKANGSGSGSSSVRPAAG